MTAERLATIRERLERYHPYKDVMFDLLAEVERLREGIEQMAAADFYDWRIRGDAEARARSANLKALIYPEESA